MFFTIRDPEGIEGGLGRLELHSLSDRRYCFVEHTFRLILSSSQQENR